MDCDIREQVCILEKMSDSKSISGKKLPVLQAILYGGVFLFLPAFFWYGSHDLWNLPRWVLTVIFLGIALPVTAFNKSSQIQLPATVVGLGLFLVLWTALSALSWSNTGDILYLMGLRATGIGLLFWFSMRSNLYQAIPFLVILGMVEVLIGAGEFLGLVQMNELMDVPMGTAGNNNMYGCLLVLLLPFSLMMANDRSGNQRMALLAIAVLIGGMASISGSKTAGLAILIATLSLLGLHFLKSKTKLMEGKWARRIIIALIPLALVTAPIVWDLVNFETGQIHIEGYTGTTERGLIWRETLDMIQEEPVLGVGPAGWKYEMMNRGVTGYSEWFGLRLFTRPHNDFLWIAAESGIPAALAYLGVLVFLFHATINRARKVDGAQQRNRYYLLAAGVLIWIVISNLNFPLERVDHLIVFAVYPALIFNGQPQSSKFAVGLRLGIGLISLVLFASLAILGIRKLQQDRHLRVLLNARQTEQPGLVLSQYPQVEDSLFTNEYYTSTPISWYKGVALLKMGQQQEALQQFQQAYRLNPCHPHVINNLASTYTILGDFDQAAIHYREAISRFREFPDPYVNLSRILRAQGDPAQALSLLNSFPDEPKAHKKAIIRELELVGQ